jgi:hypothetical protein
MAKLPAIQFYTGDWMKDPGVRSVSYAARGLWFDMLCIMAESTPRGYLSLNATPIEPELLARMTGGTAAEVSRLLTELESAGVFSRDRTLCIYSRRMVRDEEKRAQFQKYGRLGGNPDLMGNYKHRGFVYLATRSDGNVKIGASVNPVVRCQKVRDEEHDPSIRLLAKMAVDNMGTAEQGLHVKYSHYRTCGEWFLIPKPELDSLIVAFATGSTPSDTPSPTPSDTPYPPPKMKGKMKDGLGNGEGAGGARGNGATTAPAPTDFIAKVAAEVEKKRASRRS